MEPDYALMFGPNKLKSLFLLKVTFQIPLSDKHF